MHSGFSVLEDYYAIVMNDKFFHGGKDDRFTSRILLRECKCISCHFKRYHYLIFLKVVGIIATILTELNELSIEVCVTRAFPYEP
jgi:hypothetical protein